MWVTLGSYLHQEPAPRREQAEQSGAQQICEQPARTAAQPGSFIGAGSGYNRREREREDRGEFGRVGELDSRGYVSMPL